MPCRTGKAFCEARQIKVTVQSVLREPGPGQPALQRLTRGAPVWLTRRARTRSRRLSYHHQALPGVSQEDGVGHGDEPGDNTARAAGNLLLHARERDLTH